MKSINTKLLGIMFLVTPVLFGCQKESVTKSSSLSSDIVSKQNKDASVLRSVQGSNQVITLIPGLDDGQDVPVLYMSTNSAAADQNQNHLKETSIEGWTSSGGSFNMRTFLRFDNMVLIPTDAHIVSSTLYLYGLTSAESIPQGNSYYPGSPYFSYGSNACTVSRCLSNWDESTLTWNTQPATTAVNQAIIPASTSQWSYDAQVNVTALTRQYVKHPELNYGVCLKTINETPYHCMVFGSSEQTNVNLRPKLVIVYN